MTITEFFDPKRQDAQWQDKDKDKEKSSPSREAKDNFHLEKAFEACYDSQSKQRGNFSISKKAKVDEKVTVSADFIIHKPI